MVQVPKIRVIRVLRDSDKKGTFFMKKLPHILGIVLAGWLVLIVSGCDDPVTNQIDRIIDTDIADDMDASDLLMDAEDTSDFVEEPVAPPPAGLVVFVEPRRVTSPAVGQQLHVRINVKEGVDVWAYEVNVGFDPTALRYVSIANADYLPVGAFASPPQATANSVYLAATSVSGAAAAKNGTLAIVTFEVVSAKASTITLNDVVLGDGNVTPLALKTVDGRVQAP